MKIDLDLDFDYLRLYFRLEHHLGGDWLDIPDDVFDALGLEIDFTITNNEWDCNKKRAFGFHLWSEAQTITISIGKTEYEFLFPHYFFVSKTKEYVAHFNWIKEAYVS